MITQLFIVLRGILILFFFFIRNFHCFALLVVGGGRLVEGSWHCWHRRLQLFGLGLERLNHSLGWSPKLPTNWSHPSRGRSFMYEKSKRWAGGETNLVYWSFFPSTNWGLRRNNKTVIIMVTRWVSHIGSATPRRDQAKRKEGFDLLVLTWGNTDAQWEWEIPSTIQGQAAGCSAQAAGKANQAAADIKTGRKCRSQLWRYFGVPWSRVSHDRLHHCLFYLRCIKWIALNVRLHWTCSSVGKSVWLCALLVVFYF